MYYYYSRTRKYAGIMIMRLACRRGLEIIGIGIDRSRGRLRLSLIEVRGKEDRTRRTPRDGESVRTTASVLVVYLDHAF